MPQLQITTTLENGNDQNLLLLLPGCALATRQNLVSAIMRVAHAGCKQPRDAVQRLGDVEVPQ